MEHWPFLGPLAISGITCLFLGPLVLSGITGQFWPFLGPLVISGITAISGITGHFWDHWPISGDHWLFLGSLAYFWPFLGSLAYFWDHWPISGDHWPISRDTCLSQVSWSGDCLASKLPSLVVRSPSTLSSPSAATRWGITALPLGKLLIAA